MTKSYKELVGQINESDKHFKTKNNNQSEIWNRLSVHGRRAEVALAKLQKGIATFKKMDDSKNYGHVGSLEKVANDLEDLVAFLGPIKEDVDIEGKESTMSESEDLNEGSNDMRTWVIHQLEKTERPHDEILADFKKKFGADKVKQFDKIVSEIVD